MPALSKRYPALKKLSVAGPKALPWALGKLGVVFADNRDPRLVLDSTICGMNGRCHLPEKQRLPNLRHVSFFLSTCPPLQEDIMAAHKRMLIKEEERGASYFSSRTRPTRTKLHTLVQNQCLALGSSFWSNSSTVTSTLVLQARCMNLCRRFSLPVSQIHSAHTIHTGSNPPPSYWCPLILEKAGVRPRNGTDGPSNLHLWLPNFPSLSYKTSHFWSTEKPREDHRHHPLGYFHGTSHQILQGLTCNSSYQLQHCPNPMGIFLEHIQRWCYHLYSKQSSCTYGCTHCGVQILQHHSKITIANRYPKWMSYLVTNTRSQYRQEKTPQWIQANLTMDPQIITAPPLIHSP